MVDWMPDNAFHTSPVKGFVLLDPETLLPYKAQLVNQVMNGGEINTTDLAKQSTQEEVLTELQSLRTESTQARPVVVENPEMPLPEGAATSAGQTQIVSKLNELYALLGSGLSVVLDNDEALNVAVASLPLPAGASTGAKQDALLAAIQAGVSVSVVNDINAAIKSLPPVTFAPNQAVSVTGTVNVGNFPATQPVSGSVGVTNFPEATRISGSDTPLPVTANSPFPVTQSGAWALSVSNFPTSTQVSNFPATQAVTQSGTWNFGAQDSSGSRINALTADPAADARGLVTRNIPSGVQDVEVTNFPTTQPVSGTVAANQSGTWNVGVNNFPATQAVSLASVPTHPVTQSGAWTVTSNPAAPSATGSALTGYRNPALSNTAQVVKASAGRVLNYHLANMNSSAVYVHFYNAASGVTVGTTTPLVTLAVPANSVLDGAWVFSFGFSNGIMMAATTGAANATAPTNAILTMIGFV